MTDEDLDRLLSLRAEATPGDLYNHSGYATYLFVDDSRKGAQMAVQAYPDARGVNAIGEARGRGAGLPQRANAEYLTSAWNAVPALATELRTLRAALAATPITPGAVLVIRRPASVPERDVPKMVDALRRLIERWEGGPKLALMLEPDVSIESVSEDEMARHGWVRAREVAPLAPIDAADIEE